MSIKLHATKRVLLMSHSDCATYGGLAAFGGDPAREMEHHKSELEHAAALVKASFPQVAVECYFVRFDGIFRAAAEEGSAAAD